MVADVCVVCLRCFRILSDAAAEWARPLGVLNTALELSKVIADRTACVEAEIYLNMGQSDSQLMVAWSRPPH